MTMTLERATALGKDGLLALAHRSRQQSLDSFDRCDTDGFMSQWAADSMASEYRAWADLVEQGGMVALAVLCTRLEDDRPGDPVPARTVRTRYGRKWLTFATDADAETYGARPTAWIDALQVDAVDTPDEHRYTGRGKGARYRLAYMLVPATVRHTEGYTTSCYIAAVREPTMAEVRAARRFDTREEAYAALVSAR